MSEQPKSQSVVQTLGNRGLTRGMVTDYASLLGGQVGRLFFSILFFITLAKALSLGDFGLYATSSAIGVVLSRISGFGFISPLYRVATTKPRLIGSYTAGYIIAVLASAPFVILLTYAIHYSLYSQLLSFKTFALFIAAEVLFWRSLEAVIIVLNGRQKFTAASGLTIAGTASKAFAAIGFSVYGVSSIDTWAQIYCAANALVAITAIVIFYPKQRLRWKPKAWLGRSRDAFGVSAAEALFYIQSEMDKVLVLAIGGEIIAGAYAIVMRLVDLTAMPLRAFNTMLIQWIMRQRQSHKTVNLRLLVDAGVAAISIIGLLGIWVLLYFTSSHLGENIVLGASLLLFVLLVPAFRNIIEYHTELLYAYEKMASRVILLATLTIIKALLLVLLFSASTDFAFIAWWLNWVFAVLYLISALVTYRIVLKKQANGEELLDQSP